MASSSFGKLTLAMTAALALAGCQDGTKPLGFLNKKGADTATAADASGTTAAKPESSVKLVDRDVEAPDVFQVTDKGLWDGRPSLGGVWAAYPDVTDPERVIIRNPANGKFVIGALFRRELNNPGPKLQLSSDAAAALGLLAGEPATVSVTALRREEAPAPQPVAAAKPQTTKPQARPDPKPKSAAATGKIEAKPLDQVTAAAGAAIDKAEGKTAKTAKPAAKPAAQPDPTSRNFLQIGIFSIEANANTAADAVSKAGAQVAVKKEKSHGKTFWRVIAGPAKSETEHAALLKKVKDLGYSDAYFVKK